jgi:hypothetical protein
VIDFIAMSLLFDCCSKHNTNVSPAPWGGRCLSTDKQVELGNKSECGLFIDNQRILIEYYMLQREDIAWKLFGNKKVGQIGWAPGKLDSIWTSSICFVKQFYDGGVSSSHSSGENHNECMWIHHFVTLQLFHPKFRNCDDVNFLHENYSMFVCRFNSDDLKNYLSIFGKHPHFNYLWLGRFVVGSL